MVQPRFAVFELSPHFFSAAPTRMVQVLEGPQPFVPPRFMMTVLMKPVGPTMKRDGSCKQADHLERV